MIDPVISKTGLKGVRLRPDTGSKGPVKQAPSTFDRVRAQMEDRQLAVPYELPPQVTSVSAQQRTALESDLRKRLSRWRSRSPQDIFRIQRKSAQESIAALNRRVGAVPNAPAFEPLRARLSQIEAQFRDSGKLLDGLDSLDNPQDLLHVQMQMYLLTQNIELMSKVVEQVNTGVKQLLQTQV